MQQQQSPLVITVTETVNNEGHQKEAWIIPSVWKLSKVVHISGKKQYPTIYESVHCGPQKRWQYIF